MTVVTNDVVKQDSSEILRKPYQAPVLTPFGAIHHVTQGSGGNGLDANGTHTKKSDLSCKEHCVRVGEHPMGFGLYLFDYKSEFQHFGAGRQFGVVAQEVERIMPEAVQIDEDGLRKVNYSMLGINVAKH